MTTEKSPAIGLWGGEGGSAYDDGTFTGIREIHVTYTSNNDALGPITAVYDLNGAITPGYQYTSPIHNELTHINIALNFPDEYIAEVNGYYGPVRTYSGNLVKSLTFTTNGGKVYGPYGAEEGTPFSLPIKSGRIVGLLGRRGFLQDAIGFRVAADQ